MKNTILFIIILLYSALVQSCDTEISIKNKGYTKNSHLLGKNEELPNAGMADEKKDILDGITIKSPGYKKDSYLHHNNKQAPQTNAEGEKIGQTSSEGEKMSQTSPEDKQASQPDTKDEKASQANAEGEKVGQTSSEDKKNTDENANNNKSRKIVIDNPFKEEDESNKDELLTFHLDDLPSGNDNFKFLYFENDKIYKEVGFGGIFGVNNQDPQNTLVEIKRNFITFVESEKNKISRIDIKDITARENDLREGFQPINTYENLVWPLRWKYYHKQYPCADIFLQQKHTTDKDKVYINLSKKLQEFDICKIQITTVKKEIKNIYFVINRSFMDWCKQIEIDRKLDPIYKKTSLYTDNLFDILQKRLNLTELGDSCLSMAEKYTKTKEIIIKDIDDEPYDFDYKNDFSLILTHRGLRKCKVGINDDPEAPQLTYIFSNPGK